MYHLTNPKEDQEINVKTTIIGDLNSFLLDIYAVFTDSTTSYKNINNAQSTLSYDKVGSIDIHFLSYKVFNNIPFQITITKSINKNNVGLYVAISLIIIACLICSVSVFFS